MEYINPLFNHREITNKPNSKNKKSQTESYKPRRETRKDKTHNVKFPVTPSQQVQLKSLCQQGKRLIKLRGEDPQKLTQTKFNTYLLRYGLANQHLLLWTFEYKDTKTYMHTNLLETEYENEIGGPFGLKVRKNLTDRKVVTFIILSVLKWIEGEGSIEKIL